MGRAPCCDKNGLKKGPWTPEEDTKLINYIQTQGAGNWRILPKNAGLQRCGKSCRLRWTNYLRPDIKRGRFSFEEEETIIQLHSILGNKWSSIAARLPGRTDNEIKNYWNTHIRKRLLRMGIDPVTHTPRLDLLDLASILRSVLGNPSLLNLQSLLGAQALINPEALNLATTLLTSTSEHPELVSQNLPQILAGNSSQVQVDPQVQFSSQFQTPTQIPNVEGFSGNMTDMNSIPFNMAEIENLLLQPNQVDSMGDPTFLQCINNGNQNMGYDSLLSTPSSSTYVNSSGDEERDSHCSNLFKFEIPESLDINDFL